MKWLGGLVLLALSCCGVIAQDASETEQADLAAALQLLSTMPACGQQCLSAAIAASPCPLTDTSCSCSNATITGQVSACVLKSCSIRNALTTKNVSNTICHAPVRDHTHVVLYTGMVGMVIAIIAFLMRIASRAVGEGTFMKNSGLDDVVMAVAMLPVVGISLCAILLTGHGFGKDIWTVPFDSITFIAHTYYYDELLYIVALSLIKISLVLTYLRIFIDEKFRKFSYVFMGLILAYMVAFLIVTAIQCLPVPYTWLKWDGEHEGKCMHVNTQIWCAAALNIVADLIIVIMPMPMLWKMNMNIRKRLLVMSMFAVGIFVTIVSVLRLQYLVQFSESQNITWDYVRVGYWSTIEMHTSVLCACMPGIRRLLKSVWPKLVGATTHNSRDEKQSGRGNTPLPSTWPDNSTSKSRPIVSVRSNRSDDGTFIPLRDMDNERLDRAESQPCYEPSVNSTANLTTDDGDRYGDKVSRASRG